MRLISNDLEELVDRAVNGDAVALERVLRPHPPRSRQVLPFPHVCWTPLVGVGGRRRPGGVHGRPDRPAHVPARGQALSGVRLRDLCAQGRGRPPGRCAFADASRRRGARRAVDGSRSGAVRCRQLHGAGGRRNAGHAAGNPAGDPATAGGRRTQRRRNRRGAGHECRRGAGVAAPCAGQTPTTARPTTPCCQSSWCDGRPVRSPTGRSQFTTG